MTLSDATGRHAPNGGCAPAIVSVTRESLAQAVKLVPHPQPPVALGLLNVNPEPCIEVT